MKVIFAAALGASVAKMPGSGVTSEKCDVCNKKVSDDDEGLLCEKCHIWKHRICTSVSQKAYIQVSKSKQPWYCDTCKEAEKNKQKKQNQQKNYTIADVMAKLDDMDQKYNSLLAKYHEQVKQNETMQAELISIKKQLNKKEQNELDSNVIIQGIPFKESENLQQLIKKIGEKLDVPIGNNGLTAYRLGKDPSKNCPIKVCFETRGVKEQMLKSKKRYELDTKDLGYRENNKIYLNHDLTKQNVKLFTMARTFKKDHDYKYLWMSNGTIFLRKDDRSKVIPVDSEMALEN